jgi:hypothetical protein
MHDNAYNEADQKQKEQYFSYSSRSAGRNAKSEYRRHNSDHEEHKCPIKHLFYSPSNGIINSI